MTLRFDEIRLVKFPGTSDTGTLFTEVAFCSIAGVLSEIWKITSTIFCPGRASKLASPLAFVQRGGEREALFEATQEHLTEKTLQQRANSEEPTTETSNERIEKLVDNLIHWNWTADFYGNLYSWACDERQ